MTSKERYQAQQDEARRFDELTEWEARRAEKEAQRQRLLGSAVVHCNDMGEVIPFPTLDFTRGDISA